MTEQEKQNKANTVWHVARETKQDLMRRIVDYPSHEDLAPVKGESIRRMGHLALSQELGE